MWGANDWVSINDLKVAYLQNDDLPPNRLSRAGSPLVISKRGMGGGGGEIVQPYNLKLYFLFFYEWEQNRHNVPFLESASLRKRNIKAIKIKIKNDNISKKGNKKRSCHLVSQVVIDLPFEEREVEGSCKYRRERVKKAGSRREETITEPINSHIGEFQKIVVGK